MHIHRGANVIGDYGNNFADVKLVLRLRDVQMAVLFVELDDGASGASTT